ncbi:MAG: hypothetical protein ACT4OE_09840, partial [Sphingosinicella sp.]
MGLSSSKNTTKENTTQNSSQQQSATQQPIVPPWLMGPVQNYVGAIDALFGRDPQGFVAPAAPLQLMGWENAPALGDWRGQARTAAEIAAHAARQPAFRVNRPAPAAAATGQATFYQPPAIDPASLVSGQGYRAPRLADAASYAAARPAPLAPVRAASILDAPAAAMPMGAPDGPGAFQAADAGAPLAAWRNPYTEGVIEASLQDYRSGVDRQAARLAANAARNGALGGSRFGLAEGQFAADAARGEGALSAQLRDQGFRQAAELARFDTGLRQQAGLANYQGGLRQALDQAARDDAAGQHGAAARNQYGLAQAGLDEGAARVGEASATLPCLDNADAHNRYPQAEAGLGADAARYGAQAANQFGLANLAALNDMERLNSGHEWQG